MTDICNVTSSDIPALCALMQHYYAHDHLEFDQTRATQALNTLLREARGLGLGRTLMQHVTQAARDAGAVVLRLETERDNGFARAFYARLGFETLDRVLLMRAL